MGPQGARAYLVGWVDATGRIVDAGIYSEATPTPPIGRGLRTVELLQARSRFDAGGGGFGRAHAALIRMIETRPELHWVRRCRSYLLDVDRVPVAPGVLLATAHRPGRYFAATACSR